MIEFPFGDQQRRRTIALYESFVAVCLSQDTATIGQISMLYSARLILAAVKTRLVNSIDELDELEALLNIGKGFKC